MLSTDGHTTLLTIVVFTVLAAPVAGLVYGIALYSLIAFRKGGSGDEPPPDGPPIRGNTSVTILWLVVSGLLTTVLLVWGMAEYSAESTAQPNSLVVNVTGQQWLWTFSYPGTGVTTRTLDIPNNVPVQFNVTSVDVTHGFYIDSLGIQIDANPGEWTVARTTPTRLGSFVLRCSQLCGLYHAYMYAQGAVVTPTQFSKWLQSQGASATTANHDAHVTA
jgi:cytochrome c oxidase subunit 2